MIEKNKDDEEMGRKEEESKRLLLTFFLKFLCYVMRVFVRGELTLKSLL